MNATSPETDPIDVVYIAGAGRSGTTLLAKMLGELDGWIDVGELRRAPEKILENRLCECGSPLQECPFWTEVVTQAYGHFDLDTLTRLADTRKRLVRPERALHLLASRAFPGFTQEVTSWAHEVAPLYSAIRAVSGAKFIVDSSKTLAYFLGMRRSPLIRPHVVQIVRDSRAVFHSVARKTIDPSATDRVVIMDEVPPLRSPADWVLTNTGFSLVSTDGGHTLIRYEDLVAHPGRTLSKVAERVQPGIPVGDIVSGGAFVAGIHHTVDGNPMRFKHGTIKVKLDCEWVEAMKPWHKALVTAATFPFLLRYGYGLLPQAPAQAPPSRSTG